MLSVGREGRAFVPQQLVADVDAPRTRRRRARGRQVVEHRGPAVVDQAQAAVPRHALLERVHALVVEVWGAVVRRLAADRDHGNLVALGVQIAAQHDARRRVPGEQAVERDARPERRPDARHRGRERPLGPARGRGPAEVLRPPARDGGRVPGLEMAAEQVRRRAAGGADAQVRHRAFPADAPDARVGFVGLGVLVGRRRDVVAQVVRRLDRPVGGDRRHEVALRKRFAVARRGPAPLPAAVGRAIERRVERAEPSRAVRLRVGMHLLQRNGVRAQAGQPTPQDRRARLEGRPLGALRLVRQGLDVEGRDARGRLHAGTDRRRARGGDATMTQTTGPPPGGRARPGGPVPRRARNWVAFPDQRHEMASRTSRNVSTARADARNPRGKLLMAFRHIARLAAAGACALVAFAAHAFPDRPVTIVVPFAAGGPTDTVTRLVGEAMSRDLGQQIIVENVGGAGGTLGAAQVAKADADGHRLLLHHIGMATSATLYRTLPYDPLTAFAPVGLVTEVPMTIVARKDFPPADMAALLAHVKADPEAVTMANAGVGAASHLCGMMFMSALGTPLVTVPYKGTGPAMTDLIGGQVDLMCDQTTNTTKQIQAGEIKVYAVTSPERLAVLPDTPTAVESGLEGFVVGVWHGLYAPKGTPAAVVERLSAALRVALADPEVAARFAELGTAPVSAEDATPAALEAKLASEIERWRPVITAAGVFAD
jgi:tripartite-type tricarboxylate transporter receptor subunit TctC